MLALNTARNLRPKYWPYTLSPLGSIPGVGMKCRLLPPTVVHAGLRIAFVLFLFLLVDGLEVVAAEKTYVVRRGDTLSEIAERFEVPLSRLAERNSLGKTYRIYAGQRLVIPDKAAAKTSAKTAPRPVLPARVQRAIDRPKVPPGRWKEIVIHHSATHAGTLSAMDRYHRNVRHMENGLAYHFVIGSGQGLGNGEIGIGTRWTRQLSGGHVISEVQNQVSLGICLVGNFDKEKPTAKQMDALRALVRALLVRCKLPSSAVHTHQQINAVPTRCPGRNFPTADFLKSLR